MMRSLSRLCARTALALLLVTPIVALAAPPKAAPAKGKGKKVAGPKNSALSAALSDKGAGIQKCAIEHAMEKGASKVTVDVHVTINRAGAVIDRQIEISGDANDANKAKVKDCVEALVNTAKFPTVTTPLATAQQSWTIAAQ